MKNKTTILGLILLLACGFVTGAYGSTIIVSDGIVAQPGATTTISIYLDEAPDGLLGWGLNLVPSDPGIIGFTKVKYGSGYTYPSPMENATDGTGEAFIGGVLIDDPPTVPAGTTNY